MKTLFAVLAILLFTLSAKAQQPNEFVGRWCNSETGLAFPKIIVIAKAQSLSQFSATLPDNTSIKASLREQGDILELSTPIKTAYFGENGPITGFYAADGGLGSHFNGEIGPYYSRCQ